MKNGTGPSTGLLTLGGFLEEVRAVRTAIGESTTLMVDANMAWDPATAVRAAAELGRLGVYWLEEPTLPEDYKGYAEIRRHGAVRLYKPTPIKVTISVLECKFPRNHSILDLIL